MFGTRSDNFVVATFASVRELPADASALLEDSGGLFDSLAWWKVVEAYAVPAGAEPVFVTIRAAGKSIAVVPALRTGNRLTSLTTPYSCSFRPAIRSDLDATVRTAAMAEFAAYGRSAGTIRLDAIPGEWPDLNAVRTGAWQAGLIPLRFDHFGNWYEAVGGLDWSAYLQRRPGALRETIRRRLRRAEGIKDARFDIYAAPEQIDQAASEFESVYQRSWKDPEPFPKFNTALMGAAAVSGWLRLGVWSIGATPIAVQFWVVKAGRAIVLKLAHDEAFKTHSPGTVLTALMIRHLLDVEAVSEIDFGRGDDAYKRGWARQRRQHVGVLLVNPWHSVGTFALLKHGLGRLRQCRLPSIRKEPTKPLQTHPV